jgi:hypothetical protein
VTLLTSRWREPAPVETTRQEVQVPREIPGVLVSRSSWARPECLKIACLAKPDRQGPSAEVGSWVASSHPSSKSQVARSRSKSRKGSSKVFDALPAVSYSTAQAWAVFGHTAPDLDEVQQHIRRPKSANWSLLPYRRPVTALPSARLLYLDLTVYLEPTNSNPWRAR